jgi:histidyl-tRNA synthetase
MQKPQTLKGFRDFLPEEKRHRAWVASRISQAFERHGFEPLETPTLEYASLLLGKYGEEADQLVYTFQDRGDRQVGLRYDQTVPTARVLAQYQHQLPKYFRRYQMQNVFRADKPQKGRYREFAQCDCDIFGSTSPLADAEILAVYYAAFQSVGLKSLTIEVNDRQTLIQTLSPFATDQVPVLSIIQSVDKLDKLNPEEVVAELVTKGLAKTAAQGAIDAIENADLSDNLRKIVDMATSLGIPSEALVVNPKIARGLDYYTGMIFEGKIPEYSVGSVGGGGRYDNLVESLSGLSVPAVGFGIGFDRTVEAAVQLGLVPTSHASSQVLIAMFGEATQAASLKLAAQLRQAGIKTEVCPAFDKIDKQFKLADQKHIPWVAMIGEAEQADQKIAVKHLASGEKHTWSVEELIEALKVT